MRPPDISQPPLNTAATEPSMSTQDPASTTATASINPGPIDSESSNKTKCNSCRKDKDRSEFQGNKDGKDTYKQCTACRANRRTYYAEKKQEKKDAKLKDEGGVKQQSALADVGGEQPATMQDDGHGIPIATAVPEAATLATMSTCHTCWEDKDSSEYVGKKRGKETYKQCKSCRAKDEVRRAQRRVDAKAAKLKGNDIVQGHTAPEDSTDPGTHVDKDNTLPSATIGEPDIATPKGGVDKSEGGSKIQCSGCMLWKDKTTFVDPKKPNKPYKSCQRCRDKRNDLRARTAARKKAEQERDNEVLQQIAAMEYESSLEEGEIREAPQGIEGLEEGEIREDDVADSALFAASKVASSDSETRKCRYCKQDKMLEEFYGKRGRFGPLVKECAGCRKINHERANAANEKKRADKREESKRQFLEQLQERRQQFPLGGLQIHAESTQSGPQPDRSRGGLPARLFSEQEIRNQDCRREMYSPQDQSTYPKYHETVVNVGDCQWERLLSHPYTSSLLQSVNPVAPSIRSAVDVGHQSTAFMQTRSQCVLLYDWPHAGAHIPVQTLGEVVGKYGTDHFQVIFDMTTEEGLRQIPIVVQSDHVRIDPFAGLVCELRSNYDDGDVILPAGQVGEVLRTTSTMAHVQYVANGGTLRRWVPHQVVTIGTAQYSANYTIDHPFETPLSELVAETSPTAINVLEASVLGLVSAIAERHEALSLPASWYRTLFEGPDAISSLFQTVITGITQAGLYDVLIDPSATIWDLIDTKHDDCITTNDPAENLLYFIVHYDSISGQLDRSRDATVYVGSSTIPDARWDLHLRSAVDSQTPHYVMWRSYNSHVMFPICHLPQCQSALIKVAEQIIILLMGNYSSWVLRSDGPPQAQPFEAAISDLARNSASTSAIFETAEALDDPDADLDDPDYTPEEDDASDEDAEADINPKIDDDEILQSDGPETVVQSNAARLLRLKMNASKLSSLAREVFQQTGWRPPTDRDGFGLRQGINISSPLYETMGKHRMVWTRTDIVSSEGKRIALFDRPPVKALNRPNCRGWFVDVKRKTSGIVTKDTLSSFSASLDAAQHSPKKGDQVQVTIEYMLDDGIIHHRAWARLPKAGRYPDYEVANKLAVRLTWKSPVDGSQQTAYPQATVAQTTQKPAGTTNNFRGAISMIHYLLALRYEQPEPWISNFGKARVYKLTEIKLSRVVEYRELNKKWKTVPNPVYLTRDEAMNFLLFQLDEAGHPSHLTQVGGSPIEGPYGKGSRTSCDRCYYNVGLSVSSTMLFSSISADGNSASRLPKIQTPA